MVYYIHLMTITTEAAILERRADGGLEIHFREGVKITVERIREILDARENLCGKGKYTVLVTLPEEVDLDVDVLTQDHYHTRDLEDCTYAVAWDAENTMNERLVELFYTYFPQRFPVKVFRSEEEARGWLTSLDGKTVDEAQK